jgi:acetoin:2,6-dichlorophenolindophenol oxidoreductase subunit alpha
MKGYKKKFLIDLYKAMQKIRLCEESLVRPIISQAVKCPVHLYSGQEAVAVGVCAALSKKDYVFGNHRSHGHYLAKGCSLSELIAEIYGKECGCSKGRGGSMHVSDTGNGFLGSVPIVAGTISLALGSALASKIRNDERVTVSFFGDGAVGEGVLYESLNFASLKKLPLIFVCENNLYSTHLSIRECRPNKNISDIAGPFDIPALRIDGNDVLGVYETAKECIEKSRKGAGPFFIEALTYRLRGHVGPDDNVQGRHMDIRPKQEIENWKKRDPIPRFEKILIKNKILKVEHMDKIRSGLSEELEDAYAVVRRGPYPKKAQLTKYVFKD